jgi:hypothetical protein
MTEPDEALIWAREDAAKQCEKYGPMPGVDFPAEYRAGLMDVNLDDPARAYRAGQAASAERIKALEHIAGAAQQRANDHGEQLLDAYERIKALERLLGHFLENFCDLTWDPEKEPEVIEARALLKEADQ